VRLRLGVQLGSVWVSLPPGRTPQGPGDVYPVAPQVPAAPAVVTRTPVAAPPDGGLPSNRSSARRSCPPTPCPVRCAPSPNTSRRHPSSTRSGTCSPGSRSAPASGPPRPGAPVSLSLPTSSPTPPTVAGSPEPGLGEGESRIRAC